MADKRILVLDDDETIAVVLADILDGEGYRASCTTWPDQALKTLQREPVDVLVADFHMPSMTGTDVARRAKELRPQTRVVLMTGSGLLSVGGPVDAVIDKPFVLTELLKAIEG